jgi:uncharacterized protein YchJ
MEWWASFRDNPPSQAKGGAPIFGQSNLKPPQTAAISQVKNTKAKTGRNEPCPCGSGKKYKKCCGT